PQLFANRVDRLKRISVQIVFRDGLNFRVRDIDLLSEPRGFAKGHIFDSGFDLLHHPLYALKPNHFQLAFAVGEVTDQPLFEFSANDFKVGEFTLDLDVGLELVDFAYGIEFSAVLIAKWIMLYEVTERKNLQFLLKQNGSLRPDSL